jgi:hypothetical protein
MTNIAQIPVPVPISRTFYQLIRPTSGKERKMAYLDIAVEWC